VDAAGRVGAHLLRLGADFDAELQNGRVVFRRGDTEIALPAPALAGPHQVDNLATALAALLECLPRVAQDEATLGRAVSSVRVPGRLQSVSEHPPVWIDVGHNPLAAEAVAAALRQGLLPPGARRCRCVLAMLADKDAEGVASALAGVVSAWYCAGLPGPRGQSGAQLARRIGSSPDVPVAGVFETVSDALEAALADGAGGQAVLVFGSFLTAAEAGKRWGVEKDGDDREA